MSWFRSTRPALLALALIAATGVAAAAVRAQDESSWKIRENGVRILDYGIYAHSDLGLVEAPEDISGWRFTAADVRWASCGGRRRYWRNRTSLSACASG